MLSLLHPYICIVCYVDVILIFNLISCIVFEFLYMFALILFVSMSLVFPQKCYHCNDIFRSSLFLVVISVMLVILWDIVLLVCIILIHTLYIYIYILNSFAFFIVFPFAYFHFMSLCSNWPSIPFKCALYMNLHVNCFNMLYALIVFCFTMYFSIDYVSLLILVSIDYAFIFYFISIYIFVRCQFVACCFFTLNVWPGFYFILLLV